MMRHRELFDAMVKSIRVREKAELDYLIAKDECQKAKDAYHAAVKADYDRRDELCEMIDECETYEDKILFILNNKEELLDMCVCQVKRLEYQERELDREIQKAKEKEEGYKDAD